MTENWKFNRFRDRLRLLAMVLFYFSIQSSNLCLSLNDEGLALLRFKERIVSDPFNALSDWREDFGVVDSCSWFGVECSNGQVVVLNLKDLCLEGTLAPELSQLVHIKSIVLRNNSLTGSIPEEISELNELEVLDLGYNNFTGPTPADLGNNLSLTILLLDNNGNLGSLTPRLHELEMVSEFQAHDDQLSGAATQSCCFQRPTARNVVRKHDHVNRRELQRFRAPPPKDFTPDDNPGEGSISPTPLPSSAGKATAPTSTNASRLNPPSPSPTPAPTPTPMPPPESHTNASTTNASSKANKSSNRGAVMAGAIGGSAAVVILAVVVFILMKTKVTYVNPWSTGLSGQLKKAFVTGVPKLKRLELETACEDFSNVIGYSSIGTLYKGTLSSGVEIAVACVSVTSSKKWSENLELQFFKKIETLSKVNHKNFVNLIGYCQEDEPFTRMMVFEYAPNGTLFEHLHIKEAEHLDWGMRMRIAMGMAYCLDYMHQMEKPIPHNNLSSSAIRLTEDYATKISEFTFWSETSAVAPVESSGGNARGSRKLSEHREISTECNVYNFGVILFEMVTGRVPYSVDNGSLEDWASDYLPGDRPLGEMADPTLESCRDDQVEEIGRVIRWCVHCDPKRRPQMREVCIRLREITGMTPDAAAPRISPLWWAELELLSNSA